MVAGEHAEPARVERQALVDPELGREVRDEEAVERRLPVPPGRGGELGLERAPRLLDPGDEGLVGGRGLEPLVRQVGEQRDRVVVDRAPELGVERREELAHAREPRVGEVARERLQQPPQLSSGHATPSCRAAMYPPHASGTHAERQDLRHGDAAVERARDRDELDALVAAEARRARGTPGTAASRRPRAGARRPPARRTAKATLTGGAGDRRAHAPERAEVVAADLQHRAGRAPAPGSGRRRGAARRRAPGRSPSGEPAASLVAADPDPGAASRSRTGVAVFTVTAAAERAGVEGDEQLAPRRRVDPADGEHVAAREPDDRGAGRERRVRVAQRPQLPQPGLDRVALRRRTTTRCRSAASRRAPASATRRPASGTGPGAPALSPPRPIIPTSSP